MSKRLEDNRSPSPYVDYYDDGYDDDELPPVEKTSKVKFHPNEVEHRIIPNRKEVKGERNRTYIKITNKPIVHPPTSESLSGRSTPTKGSLKKYSKYDTPPPSPPASPQATRSRKYPPAGSPGLKRRGSFNELLADLEKRDAERQKKDGTGAAGGRTTQGPGSQPQQQRAQNKPQLPQKPQFKQQPQIAGKNPPATVGGKLKSTPIKVAQQGQGQQRVTGPPAGRPVPPQVTSVQPGQTPHPPNKGQTQASTQPQKGPVLPIPSVNVPPKKPPQGQIQAQANKPPISTNFNRPAQQQRPMSSPPPNRFNPQQQQQQPKKPTGPTANQAQVAQYQSYPRRQSQPPGQKGPYHPTPGKYQVSQTLITVLKMPEKIKDDSIRSVDAQTIDLDRHSKKDVKKQSTAKSTPGDKGGVRKKSKSKHKKERERDESHSHQPITASTKKINESITLPPDSSKKTNESVNPLPPQPPPVSTNKTTESITSPPPSSKKPTTETTSSPPPSAKKTTESISSPPAFPPASQTNNAIDDENPKKNSGGSDKVKLVFQIYEVEYDNDPSEIVEEAKKKRKKKESSTDSRKANLPKARELIMGSSLLSGLRNGVVNGQNTQSAQSVKSVDAANPNLSFAYLIGGICDIDIPNVPSIPKALDEGVEHLAKSVPEYLKYYWEKYVDPDMEPYSKAVGVQTSQSHLQGQNQNAGEAETVETRSRSRPGSRQRDQGEGISSYRIKPSETHVDINALLKRSRVQQSGSAVVKFNSPFEPVLEPEVGIEDANKTVREVQVAKVKDFAEYFAERGGTMYIVTLEQIDKHYKDCVEQEKADMDITLLDLLSVGLRNINDLSNIKVPRVDINFFENDFIFTLTKACSKFGLKLDHQIAALTKIHSYGIYTLQKWFKWLENKKPIDPLKIEEFAPSFLAEILVPVHSMLVLIAEYLVDISSNLGSKKELVYPITNLIDDLRGLVDCVTEEIGSVGESCAAILIRIPNLPQNQVAEVLTRVYKQVNNADMAMSHGMEIGIIPILSYYLIQEMHLSLPKKPHMIPQPQDQDRENNN